MPHRKESEGNSGWDDVDDVSVRDIKDGGVASRIYGRVMGSGSQMQIRIIRPPVMAEDRLGNQ